MASLFNNSACMPNTDNCDACGGEGMLRNVLLDRKDRVFKDLGRVKCETCNGRGRFPTAFSEAYDGMQQMKASY